MTPSPDAKPGHEELATSLEYRCNKGPTCPFDETCALHEAARRLRTHAAEIAELRRDEPTEEMVTAGADEYLKLDGLTSASEIATEIYRAMRAARGGSRDE